MYTLGAGKGFRPSTGLLGALNGVLWIVPPGESVPGAGVGLLSDYGSGSRPGHSLSFQKLFLLQTHTAVTRTTRTRTEWARPLPGTGYEAGHTWVLGVVPLTG